jgi:hypothetical protein
VKTEAEGLFVGPNEGKALPNPIGGRMVVKVRDGDTNGSYSIHDNIIPAGRPVPCPTSTAITRRPSTSSKGS